MMPQSPPCVWLPIDDALPRLIEALRTGSSAVLRAPTGAGKTTRVPPTILDAGLAGTGRIIMLQPRRLAARAAARRIAQERQTPLGADVGYQVRFDEKASRDTRILVVTEGVLLRKLQDDPFLDGVGAVLFDEFHERNLNSDVALAMVRRVQQTVRPELKVVVMSATLDPVPIAAYLDDAPIIETSGRSFPVDVRYAAPLGRRPVHELAAWGVEQVLGKSAGDVLVFLPGVAEIRRTERELEGLARGLGFELHTLYGDLPAEDQDRVLSPSPRQKLILSTNVAETSITLEGVTTVVDTGCAKVLRFDPQVGLDRLSLEPISRSSADQRAGRAGRLRPGTCLRLWDEASHRHRPEQDEPEIRRVDLAGPVLQLKSWGEQDLSNFPWYEPPRSESVAQAQELLKRLGAIDAAGRVTGDGHLMARLPVHPRLARLLLEGGRAGVSRRAAWMAALLSERDPFIRSRRHTGSASPITIDLSHHSRSDVLDRLSALEEAERSGRAEFPWGRLNPAAARFIARVRDQFLKLLEGDGGGGKASRAEPSDELLLQALVRAFPDRVARRRDVRSERGVMVGGRGVKLAPQSAVREGELFLCVDVEAAHADALVRQASAVEREWLPAESLRSDVEIFFHPSQKQVVARRRQYFLDLVLSESPAPAPPTGASAEVLFQEALRGWEQVFPADDAELTGFLARVRCLSAWMPELQMPDLGDAALQGVLRTLCGECRSFAELRRADWLGRVQSLLDWPRRQALEREAPQRLRVPSGSEIRLTYEPGRPPILAVRIQELFSLAQTPRVAGGRVPVLLHLLAPNMRPQQVTDDLTSFWENTYPAVRKELARRYPRHAWPDDPVSAKPVRK